MNLSKISDTKIESGSRKPNLPAKRGNTYVKGFLQNESCSGVFLSLSCY